MRHLFLAVVVMTGCSRTSGGSDSGANASGAHGQFAHPCALLQRADAEAILGTSNLHQEEQPGPPGDARCAWSVEAGRGLVELDINIPSRKDGFDRALSDRTPLRGVGDKAYVIKRLSWGRVDVLKGDQTFFVQIRPPEPALGRTEEADKPQAQAVALARTIAARL